MPSYDGVSALRVAEPRQDPVHPQHAAITQCDEQRAAAEMNGEFAVGDVIEAFRQVLGHEADLQVSKAAISQRYGFSLGDVLEERIDCLWENRGEEEEAGSGGSAKSVGLDLPRITGEVRVSGSSGEACSNFGSIIADTPVGKKVRA